MTAEASRAERSSDSTLIQDEYRAVKGSGEIALRKARAYRPREAFYLRPPSPRQSVQAALDYMGGTDAPRSVRTIRSTYLDQPMNVGQEEWPGAPVPALTSLNVTEVDNYQRDGMWRQYAFGSTSLTVLAVGDSGGLLDSAGQLRVAIPKATADLFREWLRFAPHRILLRALDAPEGGLRSVGQRAVRGRAFDGIEALLGRDTMRLWFDPVDHRLAAVETRSDDSVLGERTTLWEFANFLRCGEVRLPLTSSQSTNGALSWLRTASSINVNPAGSDSLGVATAKRALVDPPIGFPIVELAPGIFRLQGATHIPLAVQQGDSMVLLEAPLSDEFMHAILDSLRSRFPQTPVRSFVVTHHHSDHVAGIRVAFDAGLRAIASAEVADYVRIVGLRPNEKPRRSRVVIPVTDTLVVGAGSTGFVLYHVPTSHARGMMMAFFPERRLLFEVDLAAGPPTDRQDL